MSDEAEIAYLSKTYRQMSQKEHILEVQDTYVGSIESSTRAMLVRNRETGRLETRIISVVPALHKIVDEALMNARDHAYRMMARLREQGLDASKEKHRRVNEVRFEVDAETGTITVTNDGDGLDVALHPVHNVWIPEMVFTNPLASTNFDKGDDDVVAGKNGYGAKCTIIWSTWARLETVDLSRGLRYVQEFENNLTMVHAPVITKLTKAQASKGPFTSLSFRPDFARLKLGTDKQKLSDDFVDLLHKRAVDVACTSPLTYSVGGKNALRVFFNNVQIPQRSFKEYVQLIVPEGVPIEYERANDRWEYAIALKKDMGDMYHTTAKEAQEIWKHVSFVNGVCTYVGGTGVNLLFKQLVDPLVIMFKKKTKMEVSHESIRKQLILFLRCDVVKPAFTDQSKATLATKFDKKNPVCEISDGFVKRVAAMSEGYLLERVQGDTTKRQDRVANAAASDGVRRGGPITGIKMFTDATFARAPSQASRDRKIRLILVEGESARSGVTSGDIDPDYNGILGMRGKILNVRGAAKTKYQAAMSFVTTFVRIMGIKYGQTFKDAADIRRTARYDELVILCDQDFDGYHIKGLVMNMLAWLWPSLLRIPNFLFIWETPIVIVREPKAQPVFWYDLHDYHLWAEANPLLAKFGKYYKGLGTSNKKEWGQYVSEPKLAAVEFTSESDACLEKVFGKKSDVRKAWLLECTGNHKSLNLDAEKITVEDFINYQMVQFSNADNIRSIPSVMDGLKPSQRKVLFACFQRNLTGEVKVSHLAGNVAEVTHYHHGEASMQATIIGLAQDFVGSNNINLLFPAGQFGTRLVGGEDKASARYIFTRLTKSARLLFPQFDDYVIPRLLEDGDRIEPAFYYPVIPMLLVNGAAGIGTGWRVEISPRDSLDLVEYIRKRLLGLVDEARAMVFKPFLEGHFGTVCENPNKPGQFESRGIWKRVNSTEIEITELPFYKWTNVVKEMYESMILEPEKKSSKSDGDLLFASDDKDRKTTHKRKRDSLSDDVSESARSEAVGPEKKSEKETPKILKDVLSSGGDCNVRIRLLFHSEEQLDSLLMDITAFEKLFDLVSPIQENLTAFCCDGKICEYDSIHSILEDFFEPRLELYSKRKQFQLDKLAKDANIAECKARFIRMVRNGELQLSRCLGGSEARELLAQNGFEKRPEDKSDYEYLLAMRIDTQTEKRANELDALHGTILKEMETLQNKTREELWLSDLTALENEILENRKTRLLMSTPGEKTAKKEDVPKSKRQRVRK